MSNSTIPYPPGSSARGVSQARILEWVAISFFREISPTLGSNPCLLCLLHWQADSLHWATWKSTSAGCLKMLLVYFFIYRRIIALQKFVSVKPQHESAIGIHISPPFWTSLPSPAPSRPSSLIQSPCLSFLSHTGLLGLGVQTDVAASVMCVTWLHSFLGTSLGQLP